MIINLIHFLFLTECQFKVNAAELRAIGLTKEIQEKEDYLIREINILKKELDKEKERGNLLILNYKNNERELIAKAIESECDIIENSKEKELNLLSLVRDKENQLSKSLESIKKEKKCLKESYNIDEITYNEKITSLSNIIKDLNEKLLDRKYWKQISLSLAQANVQVCAGALTIPEFQINNKTVLSMGEHIHGFNSLLKPLSHGHNILQFLRINSLRGNVLVSKDLLSTVLLMSKVSHFFIFPFFSIFIFLFFCLLTMIVMSRFFISLYDSF